MDNNYDDKILKLRGMIKGYMERKQPISYKGIDEWIMPDGRPGIYIGGIEFPDYVYKANRDYLDDIIDLVRKHNERCHIKEEKQKEKQENSLGNKVKRTLKNATRTIASGARMVASDLNEMNKQTKKRLLALILSALAVGGAANEARIWHDAYESTGGNIAEATADLNLESEKLIKEALKRGFNANIAETGAYGFEISGDGKGGVNLEGPAYYARVAEKKGEFSIGGTTYSEIDNEKIFSSPRGTTEEGKETGGISPEVKKQLSTIHKKRRWSLIRLLKLGRDYKRARKTNEEIKGHIENGDSLKEGKEETLGWEK